MNTKPIIFSGAMIRALLDGRKTQTRRVVKPQPTGTEVYPPESGAPRQAFQWIPAGIAQAEDIESRLCPYGQPGDLLWVRETWTTDNAALRFRADYDEIGHDKLVAGCWHPSIYMPRKYSRLTLRLTDVRVERVREISEADAIAEGIEKRRGPIYPDEPRSHYIARELFLQRPFARGLIESGREWVWVLAFDVIHANVDDVLAEPDRYGVAT